MFSYCCKSQKYFPNIFTEKKFQALSGPAYYIYYCGQESLRRNGVAIMVNKRVQNAVLGCNLKNDRMISVHFQVHSLIVSKRCYVFPCVFSLPFPNILEILSDHNLYGCKIWNFLYIINIHCTVILGIPFSYGHSSHSKQKIDTGTWWLGMNCKSPSSDCQGKAI